MDINEIMGLFFLSPSIFILINLILLSIWLPVTIYGVYKRSAPWFLFGIALFTLFIYDWLLFSSEIGIYSGIDIFNNFFFELLFLYSFFYLYLRIYEEREALGLSSNLFHSRSLKIRNLNDFFLIQGDVFSFLGGIVFFTSLYILIEVTESTIMLAVFTTLYFLAMYFRVEKKCFYLEKDYAYFGSPWTQKSILRTFRIFSATRGLIFVFYLVMALGHFINIWDFEKAITEYLDILLLVRILTVLVLVFFTIQLFSTKKKLQKKLTQARNEYSTWMQQILISYEQVSSETHPEYYYPNPENPADYGILHLFTKVLEKTKSDLIYLTGEKDDWPNLRLVASKDPNTSTLNQPLFKLNQMSDFNLEDYFPGLTNLISKGRTLFVPNIEERSSAFRRHFTKLVKSYPNYTLRSLIIFPFTHRENSATLLLVNPKFSEEYAYQPMEAIFLKIITNTLTRLDFEKITKAKRANQTLSSSTNTTLTLKPNSDKSESTTKPSANKNTSTTSDPWGFTNLLDNQEDIEDESIHDPFEDYAEDPETPESEFDSEENSAEPTIKLFPNKKNIEKFIAEEQIESVYREQIEKVYKMFTPARFRLSDKIEYHTENLFTELIPNSITMASNISNSEKILVFNELKQPPPLIASSSLSLQNLFYNHLKKRDVITFMREWFKGFKAFNKNDSCHTLAMEFDSESHILTYYNVGIKDAYFYDCSNEIFSPLRIHQNKIPHNSTGKEMDKKSPTRIDLQTGDFIVVFSNGMKMVKNRAGRKLEESLLFNLIKKNQHGSAAELIAALKDEIKEFSYSLPAFQQTLFIAKII